MISADFLSSDTCFTYVRSARVTRHVLKYDTVFPILRDLSVKGAATGNIGVTHIDDTTVYNAI